MPEELLKQLMPWVKEYYDGQLFYNNGTPQQLQEVTVTASNRPEDRMRANLQSSIEQRQAKDARDNYTIQHNMSLTGANIAKGVFEAASIPASFNPVVGGVLGATYGATAAKDMADNGLNWSNGLQLGLSALPLGRVGYKGIQLGKLRVLDAAYNNFTPLGYADHKGLPFMNHGLEFKDMMKDIFIPRRINTSADVYPKWYQRAMNYASKHPDYNPTKFTNSFKELLDFRDEAWRLATNQKPRTNLYLPNGDGTYSYNMNIVGKPRNSSIYVKMNSDNTAGVGNDLITGNGGFASYQFRSPLKIRRVVDRKTGKIIPDIGYAGSPEFTMVDTWDLLPFKDSSRTFSPLITKLGTKYPKIFGSLKNIEALEFLGGNPFKLKHEVPEGTFNIFTKDIYLPE